mmetsp:Transcript_8032/g.22929  ORF Transcript_8032/g.22929 Transcript_8032/m.22929 type:complete len:308 (-) Transcript_8032:1780-2703(-)
MGLRPPAQPAHLADARDARGHGAPAGRGRAALGGRRGGARARAAALRVRAGVRARGGGQGSGRVLAADAAADVQPPHGPLLQRLDALDALPAGAHGLALLHAREQPLPAQGRGGLQRGRHDLDPRPAPHDAAVVPHPRAQGGARGLLPALALPLLGALPLALVPRRPPARHAQRRPHRLPPLRVRAPLPHLLPAHPGPDAHLGRPRQHQRAIQRPQRQRRVRARRHREARARAHAAPRRGRGAGAEGAAGAAHEDHQHRRAQPPHGPGGEVARLRGVPQAQPAPHEQGGAAPTRDHRRHALPRAGAG